MQRGPTPGAQASVPATQQAQPKQRLSATVDASRQHSLSGQAIINDSVQRTALAIEHAQSAQAVLEACKAAGTRVPKEVQQFLENLHKSSRSVASTSVSDAITKHNNMLKAANDKLQSLLASKKKAE
jgi:hypothetical protein